MTSQSPHGVLNALRNLRQSLARLDVLLCILADLTVDLSTLTVLLEEVIVYAIQVTLLLVGGTVGIVVLVFNDLAFGVLAVGEEVGDRNPWRGALNLSTTLLLLLRLPLLLLFGGWRDAWLLALPRNWSHAIV